MQEGKERADLGRDETMTEEKRYKLTKEFSHDFRLLAEKIAYGKVEPMEALCEFQDLIHKQYGKDIDIFLGEMLHQNFQTYLQIFTFSRLMKLITLFCKIYGVPLQ